MDSNPTITKLVELDGSVAVFELLGEHDMASAPELRAALNETVEEGCGIVADLSQTQFIDSSAIRVRHNGITHAWAEIALD